MIFKANDLILLEMPGNKVLGWYQDTINLWDGEERYIELKLYDGPFKGETTYVPVTGNLQITRTTEPKVKEAVAKMDFQRRQSFMGN